jgi:hypothetical protein
MSPEFPREIVRHADGAGVTYDFPRRRLGGIRWLGLFFIVFGLLFLRFPVRQMISQIVRALNGTGQAADLFSLLVTIPFLIGGLFPLGIGLLILVGRCRLVWRNRQLKSVELVGPFHWTRCLPEQPIRSLEVSFGSSTNGKPVTTGPLADIAGLVAKYDSGKPRPLVIGYPRSWLTAVAHDLAPQVNPLAGVRGVRAVEVVETATTGKSIFDPVAEATPEEIVQQPAGSKAKLDQRADGLSLAVPPAGIRKGTRGLFFFAAFWCAFMAVFTGLMFFATGTKGRHSTPWEAAPFLLLFWLVGIGLMAGALNMARRRALFIVDRNCLRLAQAGLFGTKSWVWRREDIASIRTDASGMKVNNQPVIELQIHPRGAKKIGILAGRDEAELRWIASTLRRASHLPTAPAPNTPPVSESPST